MWRAASSASHSACYSLAYRYAGVSVTSAGVARCPDELDAVALRRTGRFAGREAPDRLPFSSAGASADAAVVVVSMSLPTPASASSAATLAAIGRLFVASGSAIAAASASATTR